MTSKAGGAVERGRYQVVSYTGAPAEHFAGCRPLYRIVLLGLRVDMGADFLRRAMGLPLDSTMPVLQMV